MSEELQQAENIYNLLPKDQVDAPKLQRFLSESNKPAVKLRAAAEPPDQRPAKKPPAPPCVCKQRGVCVRTLPAHTQQVDHHRGHKQHWAASGLQPTYTKKKDYGKVPGYLQRLREEQLRAQEELDHKQEVLRQLQEEEIQALLENLKKNWNALHDEYQRLSLVTDTQSKRSRKERLEAEMKHLESRIESFQRFKIIYTLTDTHT